MILNLTGLHLQATLHEKVEDTLLEGINLVSYVNTAIGRLEGNPRITGGLLPGQVQVEADADADEFECVACGGIFDNDESNKIGENLYCDECEKVERPWACDNCDWRGGDNELKSVFPDIPNLASRVEIGGIVPAGECPKCGSLCYGD